MPFQKMRDEMATKTLNQCGKHAVNGKLESNVQLTFNRIKTVCVSVYIMYII